MLLLNLIICVGCFSYLFEHIGLMSFVIIPISFLLTFLKYRPLVFLFLIIISGLLSYNYPIHLIFFSILIFIFKLKDDYREYLVNILSSVFFVIVLLSLLGLEYSEHFIIIILLHWVICNMIYQKKMSFSTFFLAFPIIWFLIGVFTVILFKKASLI